MKRASTILIVLLLGLNAAFAQETESSTQRTWSMGPLTWDDFTTVVRETAATPNPEYPVEHSFLEFVFDIRTVVKEHDGIKTGDPEAVAYTLKNKSWADSAFRTPAELRYNQVLFDMVELFRRRLQQWLIAYPDYNDEAFLDSIMQLAIDSTDAYCSETRFGQDTDAVLEWQQRMHNALTSSALKASADSAAVRAQYAYVDDPFRLGGSLSAVFLGTGGELHDYFSHGGGLGLGFEMGFNRHFFILEGSVGAAKCLQDAPNAEDPINNLFVDDPLEVLSGWFAYGFSVVDRTRLRITPFVGWGGLGYFFTEDDDSSDDATSFGSGNGCWHFGLDMQYHFHNSIFGMEHDRFSLDLKVYGARNHFRSIEGAPEGFTLNVMLGISLLTGGVERCRL